MMSKIEWYKEVLELEPHSKLFFPLARLYVAEERYDEALETLSIGLRQHPEFLEARLLLLEVLNVLGQAGDLSEQASVLASTISGYYTFWQAWAHLLTHEQGGKDTALAVNFLASHFKGKPLSWADVIERGIRSLIFDESEAPEPSVRDYGEDAASIQASSQKVENVVSPEAAVFDAILEKIPEAHDVVLDDLMEADVDQLHAVSGKGALLVEKTADEDRDVALGTSSSKDLVDVEGEAFRMPAAAYAVEAEQDDEDEEDEPFSLRTRTMADLLAEQGDFEGALDIYRELLTVTPPGDGHDTLAGLIKEMNVKIREKKGLQPAQSGKRKMVPKVGNSESGGLSGKKKLMDTLELLAQRLEARGTG